MADFKKSREELDRDVEIAEDRRNAIIDLVGAA